MLNGLFVGEKGARKGRWQCFKQQSEDLLSCWWVVSQVFKGFLDESWDWWWLRKVVSGGLESIFISDVCKSDVFSFGWSVWESSLGFLSSKWFQDKLKLISASKNMITISTYNSFILCSSVFQLTWFLGFDSLWCFISILVWVWVDDWIETDDCV